MKYAYLLIALAAASASPSVFAAKPCDELKGEIASKIEAKGVKAYTLEVLAGADAAGKTVVGSCEAGSKKIVYEKK